MKEAMVVSFSGGRTSAYMSKWLIDNKSDEYDFVFVFMNTGQEHEKTLEFVDKCDVEFGLNLIWIEGITHHDERKGSTHKIVTYKTASKNGEPFEEMIKKYGIPNKSYPHCNRELKLNPFNSLMKELGLSGAKRAIGIRVDEIDRMSIHADKNKIVYPLISMTAATKSDVVLWWKDQNFDLEIEEHYGNCVTCWKKSIRKLMTISNQDPNMFEFFRKCESLYPTHGAGDDSRVFFRENRSTEDIFKKAKEPFIEFTERKYEYQLELDMSNGCSESCDIFADA